MNPAVETERRPIPARTVRTRRIAFDYSDGALPRHFVSGDLVMSHVTAVLSAMFPEGEDFFVRTVRNYRDQITDPELKKQVAGFIGQEAMHGREHRSFNERLHACCRQRCLHIGRQRFVSTCRLPFMSMGGPLALGADIVSPG